jgi:hypothetical protein
VRSSSVVIGSALLLGALACSPSDSWSVSSEPNGQKEANRIQAPLIQRIAGAPLTAKYRGERLIEAEVVAPDQVHRLLLKECVASNGEGGFSIEPLDLIEPALSQPREELALAIQRLREGFHFRYRDFAIRNLPLFLQNYTVTDTGTAVPIAGFPCKEWLVQGQLDLERHFRICVEPGSALVLRAIEEDTSGHVISRMEFLTLDLAPNLEGIPMHVPLNAETPLNAQDASEILGFQFVKPHQWPAGFELAEQTSVTEPGTGAHWAKLTFSDGLEQVFYLHGGPVDLTNALAHGWPTEPDTVRWLPAPPWNLVQGNVHGQKVLAAGKVTQLELMRMLESAQP